MMSFAFCAVFLFLFWGLGQSHMQPGMARLEDSFCTSEVPEFQSYHIHTLFWGNNANSTKEAEKLLEAFKTEFNLSSENACKYSPGSLAEKDLCYFPTDYEAAGPFLTAQTAVFVPVEMMERTVQWTLRHKGHLDVLVHPNTGCGIQDHLFHALWAGNKWELDASIFLR